MSVDLLKIYIFKFFDSFVLIFPFYVLMFAENGITPEQIGWLLAIWTLVVFVLEVPSGVLADRYSRKHLLFCAQLIRASGFLFWLLLPNFWGFLAGFILWGTKSALTSGTYQALLYDFLRAKNHEQDYAKIAGRAKTISYLAILAAAGLAALVVPYGYSIILILSALAAVISGTAIFLLPQITRQESTQEQKYFLILREALFFARKDFQLLKLIFMFAIVRTLSDSLDEFYPIFADLKNISKAQVALFIGAIAAAQAIGAFFAHRMLTYSNIFLYSLMTIAGLIFYLAAIWQSAISLALVVAYTLVYAVIALLFETKIQQQAPSNVRATIFSLSSLFLQVGSIALYLAFGYSAGGLGYEGVFNILGLVATAIGLICFIISLYNAYSQRPPV